MNDYIISNDFTDEELEELKKIMKEEMKLLIELGIHEYLKERED